MHKIGLILYILGIKGLVVPSLVCKPLFARPRVPAGACAETMFGDSPGAGGPSQSPQRRGPEAPRPRGDKTLDMLHERITDLPPRRHPTAAAAAGHFSAARQRGEAVSPGTHPRERRGSTAQRFPPGGRRRGSSITRAPPGRLLEVGAVEERRLVELLLLLHQEHQVPHVDSLDAGPQRHRFLGERATKSCTVVHHVEV